MIPGDTLGERARWARETAGLSLDQAATAVSVPTRFLVDLETGADEPGVMRVHLLAHLPGLYGVSARWLAQGLRRQVPPETAAMLKDVEEGAREDILYMLSVLDG